MNPCPSSELSDEEIAWIHNDLFDLAFYQSDKPMSLRVAALTICDHYREVLKAREADRQELADELEELNGKE